jgi:hypothetical protein
MRFLPWYSPEEADERDRRAESARQKAITARVRGEDVRRAYLDAGRRLHQ